MTQAEIELLKRARRTAEAMARVLRAARTMTPTARQQVSLILGQWDKIKDELDAATGPTL